MNVIIIEDERPTAEDLAETIVQADAGIKIVTTIKSVQEGRLYFSDSQVVPDLIFSDIQLGDGLSFEFLNTIACPVIFCTAYDEYALQAFKANGIDYILKPFTLSSVSAALQKYRLLTGSRTDQVSSQHRFMQQMLDAPEKYQQISALLVYEKDAIIPIKLEDIAFFRLENELVRLQTFSQKLHFTNKTLDELEKTAGQNFYRANRQYLVNRRAVAKVSSLLSRKLSVTLTLPNAEGITVSKEKGSDFLKWLSGINA